MIQISFIAIAPIELFCEIPYEYCGFRMIPFDKFCISGSLIKTKLSSHPLNRQSSYCITAF